MDATDNTDSQAYLPIEKLQLLSDEQQQMRLLERSETGVYQAEVSVFPAQKPVKKSANRKDSGYNCYKC